MHPRIIWAIARKDAIDLYHNRAALGGLLAPVFLSLVWLLIGKVFGSTVTQILVYNPGGSPAVVAAQNAFNNPQVTTANSMEEVFSAFDAAEVNRKSPYAVGLVIPNDFESRLSAGEKPEIWLYMDGKKVNSLVQAAAQSAITAYSRARANQPPPIDLVTKVVNSSSRAALTLELQKFYAPLAVLVSLIIGTGYMPQLLIEEKEKKTLRMMMVTPASFTDVILGKVLIVFVYQFALTLIVIATQKAFTGQVGLVVLYAFLGGCFSLALGLLLGTVFNTTGAAGAVQGPVMMVFIIAGIFVGPLGEIIGTSPVARFARLIPTYYIAEGISNASQSLGTIGGHLLDIGVIAACTIALAAASTWILRRQAAVAALI